MTILAGLFRAALTRADSRVYRSHVEVGRVTEFVRVDDTVRRPPTGSSASVRQLLTHLEEAGFEEGPRAVPAGQVVCHGDIAPRNTVFADGRATAFIDWDGIFVASPMWDLAHAVWQFAPVCGDADQWLEGWPSTPDRSARIAALVGGYGPGAGGADELAAMVVEVIAGCTRAMVRKIAAGIPAFVQMDSDGILATLDSQHRAAEQLRPLVAQAAANAEFA